MQILDKRHAEGPALAEPRHQFGGGCHVQMILVGQRQAEHEYGTTMPVVPEGYESVWAQYTIRLAPGKRDGLARALQAEGIPTAIYYAKPLHKQTAYRDFPVAAAGLSVSERLADEVISLPMHAYLDEVTQDRIVDAVKRALR